MRETHTVRPSGGIDLATAEATVAPWYHLVETEDPTTLIVDLSDVTFVDSSGLSALIRLRKRATAHGGRVLLRGASWQIRKLKLLSITALDRTFPEAHLPAERAAPNGRPPGSDGPDDQPVAASPDMWPDARA